MDLTIRGLLTAGLAAAAAFAYVVTQAAALPLA